MRTLRIIAIAALLLGMLACEKGDDINVLRGDQSTIGTMDNSFTFSFVEGVDNINVEITDLTDGISTIDYSAKITNPTFLSWANLMSDVDVNGNMVSGTRRHRITTEGIQSVFDDGTTLMMVKYDAKVGDEYTLDRGAVTWKRKVVRRSTDDDYFWGGWIIKTIDVETNEYNFPGVSYFKFYFNHRFGLVGVQAFFEDGTSKSVNIYSMNSN